MNVELADELILVRPYRAGDVDSLHEAVVESRAELTPWLPWCHPDYSRDESAQWVAARKQAWEAKQDYSFAIVDRAGARMLGGCGINQIDWDRFRANLGYWVRTSATRRGVASRAARMVARFGIQELGLLRLEILAAVDNHASRKVATKAGAVFEGIARNRLRTGRQHDAACFSFIPEDFQRDGSPWSGDGLT